MSFTGIHIASDRFEILEGGRAVGPRRDLDADTVSRLESYAQRYRALTQRPDTGGGLLTLGRELFDWLDGGIGAMTRLRARPGALELEIHGPTGPSSNEWALMRAPFELLADEDSFLAREALLGFSVVRRIGPAEEAVALSDHRLGLVFMASAPRGQHELDYEGEEAAILKAVNADRLDLVVEESGDPEQLGRRLADLEEMQAQAIHLSCHGLNNWKSSSADEPKPVLMMEDEKGGERPTGAAELLDALPTTKPRLLFLSACLTAAAAGDALPLPPHADERRAETEGSPDETVTHSLATALVGAGCPAVLGWEGSVADRAAIAFASKLYEDLGERKTLASAVAAARRELLSSQDAAVARDWHLARLWLGPQGGGAIIGGKRKRSLLPPSHAHKIFLDAKDEVPVASPEMFVGRRRQLQEALRVLRGTEHSGLLIHGMGRLGKSSLAARIARRMPDMATAVVFKHYDALSVVEVLQTTLSTLPEARDLLEQRRDDVRQDESRLEALLIDLFGGPCAQAVDGQRPVLLVIDDLERILEPTDAGRHRVMPHSAPVLRMILRAFDRAETDSRLLLTSRFTFELDGLEKGLCELPLPPFTEAAQRKLELRQSEAARETNLGTDEFEKRSELLPRVRAVSRGNPGLQDLIGQKLVLSEEVPRERAERALEEMEQWLAGGDLPDAPEVQAFLENLAVDTLLEVAGAAGHALLQALTLFQVPVPEAAVTPLGTAAGGALSRLCGLGLVDTFEDPLDPREDAFAVNALAKARLEELGEERKAELARLALPPLFGWWAEDGGARSLLTDLELTRLALLAEDADVVATCGTLAIRALQGAAAEARATFGQKAVELLEREGRPLPWLLLSQTASAVATAGAGRPADALFAKGVEALEERRKAGDEVDPFEAGFLLMEYGRRLRARGDLPGAQRAFEEAVELARESGNDTNVTIARGEIADIHFLRGELDEALRIRAEEELPVYERLGDVRSVALTKGQIADILESRGDLDEALRIRTEEELPVLDRLGDVREFAITKGKIADILFRQGDLDEALRILTEEQLPVLEQLGDVREISVTRFSIAQLRLRKETNNPEDLHAVFDDLETSFAIASQLGLSDGVAAVGALLGQVLAKAGHSQARDVLEAARDANLKLGQSDAAAQLSKVLDELPKK